MVGKGRGKGPKLHKKVVDTLLDKLSTDKDFRETFKRDPKAALTQAGWTPTTDPADAPDEQEALRVGGCLTMTAGVELASMEDIARDRDTIASDLALPFTFQPPSKLLFK